MSAPLRDFGLKLGDDAISNSLELLRLYSKYPVIKKKKSGTGSVSVTSDAFGEYSFSVVLDKDIFDYLPFIKIWCDVWDAGGGTVIDYVPLPYGWTSASFGLSVQYDIYVDNTNHQVVLAGSAMGVDPSTNKTLDYKYEIKYDKVGL